MDNCWFCVAAGSIAVLALLVWLAARQKDFSHLMHLRERKTLARIGSLRSLVPFSFACAARLDDKATLNMIVYRSKGDPNKKAKVL